MIRPSPKAQVRAPSSDGPPLARGTAPKAKPRRDETLIEALLRAHRWRRQIENDQARSMTELAEQEGVTDAYMCRLLR